MKAKPRARVALAPRLHTLETREVERMGGELARTPSHVHLCGSKAAMANISETFISGVEVILN